MQQRIPASSFKTTAGIRRGFCLVVACFFASFTGCRMGVPIHVWKPPSLESTVGKTVLVPPLIVPRADDQRVLAQNVHQRLLASAPGDQGRSTKLLDPDDLPDLAEQGRIALVSYDQNDPSDLVTSEQARRGGAEFILQGELLSPRVPRRTDDASKKRLMFSWRLTPIDPVSGERHVGESRGLPVTVSLDEALKKHPDLALADDPENVLRAASVREALCLITPSVSRQRVQLEIPYGLPDSKKIRDGNLLARQGRWPEAEQAWLDVRRSFPWSSVAVHNLAIAAAARQDFSEARRLAQTAVRMKPTRLHQRTLVWIERRQQEFHQAFELPDPPEGWFLTRAPVAPDDSNRATDEE